MRKFVIILAVILCMPSVCVARNGNVPAQKRLDKMVRKYDVDVSVKEAENVGEFWDLLWRSNGKFMRFYKACEKSKPTARKTFKKYAVPKRLTDSYKLSLTLMDDFDSTIEDLLTDIGVEYMEFKPRIYVVADDEFNAYSYPEGDIYIQSGVLTNPGMTYWGLVGICVHEYAHYLLQHALAGIYDGIRKEKSALAIASVLAVMNTAAAAYSSASGNYVDWNAVDYTNYALFDSAFLITDQLIYKYSREQEIEADIIAFRFLEYIGVGGEYYINALALAPEAHYSSTSDHPSLQYRITLLNYMKSHEGPGLQRDKPSSKRRSK